MESVHMLPFVKAEAFEKEHNVSHKPSISAAPRSLSSWNKKGFSTRYVFN